MEYPIEGIKVEGLDENEEYQKFILNQHAYKCGFVRLMPYNQVLPKTYIKFAKRIHGFHVHQDDVWISSFPKCGNNLSGLFLILEEYSYIILALCFKIPNSLSKGTTWTQEMVWCIVNNLDFKSAKATSLENRVPFFEYPAISDSGEQSFLCKIKHNKEFKSV